jgi:hypothetical protein
MERVRKMGPKVDQTIDDPNRSPQFYTSKDNHQTQRYASADKERCSSFRLFADHDVLLYTALRRRGRILFCAATPE